MNVAFYSYKGGVGRSQLMSNCGYILSSCGLRVLLIDFDLEAPSLETYFSAYLNQKSERKKGALEMFEDIEMAMLRPDFKERYIDTVKDGVFPTDEWIDDYVVKASLPDSVLVKGGELNLMNPTKLSNSSPGYASRVRDFSWKEFRLMSHGESVFNWLREAIFPAYDMVLIDTRTGFTEVGSLVWRQLADAYVMVMAPNKANLEGTGTAIKFFAGSESEGKPCWVIPSRIPMGLYEAMVGAVSKENKRASSDLTPGQKWLDLVKKFPEEFPESEVCMDLAIRHNSEAAGVETIFSASLIEELVEHRGKESVRRSENVARQLGVDKGMNSPAMALIKDGGQGQLFGRDVAGVCARLLKRIINKTEKSPDRRVRNRLNRALSAMARLEVEFPLFEKVGNKNDDSSHPGQRGSENNLSILSESKISSRAKIVVYCSEDWGAIFEEVTAKQKNHVKICSILGDNSKFIPVMGDHEIWVFPLNKSDDGSFTEELMEACRGILQRNRFGCIRSTLNLGSMEGYEDFLSNYTNGIDGERRMLEAQSLFHVHRVILDDRGLEQYFSEISDLGNSARQLLGDSVGSGDFVISNAAPGGLSNEQMEILQGELHEKLDRDKLTGSALKWWDTFLSENGHRPALIVRLMEELVRREASISEFFLSYVYSNTDNIMANLHYLDYSRLKKEEEARIADRDKSDSA